jgi:hypothetical protein
VVHQFGGELDLRVAICRRDVEVIDAGVEDILDHLVRRLLFEEVQCDGAER